MTDKKIIDAIKNYCDGRYDLNYDIDNINLKIDSLIKNNRLDLIKNDDREKYQGYNNVLHMRDIINDEIDRINLNRELLSFMSDNFILKIKEAIKENKMIYVFPMVFPLAFGDCVVINQYINKFKNDNENSCIIIIAPINQRPDLNYLFTNNKSIDYLIDITCDIELEKNRLDVINQMIGDVHRISFQEKLIISYLDILINITDNFEVIKMRYLPVLNKFSKYCYSTGRIWENRIKNNDFLPKTYMPENIEKNKSIVIHFRDADYGDIQRNIPLNYQQDIVNKLIKEFPNHTIYQIGDQTMLPMQGVIAEFESLEKQIKLIAEAELFIGCHSAPQMMAVACSDTPIICICYTMQETAELANSIKYDSQIAKKSYEPFGSNRIHVFYNKCYDKTGKEILPIQNNPNLYRSMKPDINDIILKAKEFINEKN